MLGEGILKGLAETAKNFAGSFVSKERLTTVQYPEERMPVAGGGARFPFLVYDGDGLGGGAALRGLPDLRERVPAEVHLSSRRARTRSRTMWARLQFYPAKFDIDISVCMSCQICVEVCPFEAIKMDTEFELATDDRFGGLLHGSQAAGEIERVLSPDSSHRGGRGGRAAAEEKAKAEAKAKAAAEAALQRQLLRLRHLRTAATRACNARSRPEGERKQ